MYLTYPVSFRKNHTVLICTLHIVRMTVSAQFFLAGKGHKATEKIVVEREREREAAALRNVAAISGNVATERTSG